MKKATGSLRQKLSSLRGILPERRRRCPGWDEFAVFLPAHRHEAAGEIIPRIKHLSPRGRSARCKSIRLGAVNQETPPDMGKIPGMPRKKCTRPSSWRAKGIRLPFILPCRSPFEKSGEYRRTYHAPQGCGLRRHLLWGFPDGGVQLIPSGILHDIEWWPCRRKSSKTGLDQEDGVGFKATPRSGYRLADFPRVW